MDRQVRIRLAIAAAALVAGLAVVAIALVMLGGDEESSGPARGPADAGRIIGLAGDAGIADGGIPDEPVRPGYPVVDPALPPGSIRVTVTRSWDGQGPAVAGATVHLVTTRVGGSFEHRALTTSTAGEIALSGLVTDGSAAYYLLADVDGDRLESAPLTPRPDAGLRVQLHARTAGSRLPPVDGIGSPEEPVPAGEALVEPFPAAAGPIELIEVVSGGEVSGPADVDGRARFTGLATGAVYIARMQVGDRVHLSTPFLVVAGRGVRRKVWAAPMPIARCEHMLEVEAGPLPFTVELAGWSRCELLQYDGAPHPAVAGGLRFSLPAGGQRLKLDPRAGPGARLDQGSVLWTRPLPPGGLELRALFRLPVAAGRAEFVLDPAFRLYGASVTFKRGQATAVGGLTGGTERVMADEDGIDYHLVDGPDLRPGSPLRFSITGLPSPGPCDGLEPDLWRAGRAPAPDITGTDRDGKRHRLADLRGKVVVLNLWASWCPPCREELGSLAALQRRFPRDQVVVLALSSDPTWTDAARVADPHRELTFWLDPPTEPVRYNIGAMASALGTRRLPETYLVDRRGDIRHRIVNTRDWNSTAATACIDALIGDLGP